MLRFTDISYVAGMFHYFFFRLKEHKVKSEEEHQEELDVYSKTSQDLKTRLDTLQLELNEKQVKFTVYVGDLLYRVTRSDWIHFS
jgi:hypothetical protein